MSFEMMRVIGSDGDADQTSKSKEVILMIHAYEDIIEQKVRLPNLAEELGNTL
jgi:hypothetical protein